MDDPFSLLGTVGRHGHLAFQGLKAASHVLKGGGNAAALAEALGHMRGPVVKIAQFLATLPEVLPPEYVQALAGLQNQAPPMVPILVKRRMANELGADWHQHFSSFNMAPSFAASLGQVHQGVLNDGRVVACKLQYPRMEHVIEADLTQLQWWIGLYKAVDGTIDHADILKEIRAHLGEELDYVLEQKNMVDFAAHYAHLLKVPGVVSDLSTSKLLTMTWQEGDNVWDAKLSPEDKARALFRAWYTPFYEKGWLHADPHPGNYAFDANGQLIVFDFGCVRRFSDSFVKGVKLLHSALCRSESPLEAFALWGFKDVSPEAVEALTLWAQLLFEPLLDDCVRPLYDDPHNVRKRAENVYQALQKAGGIKPPREFVLMDRTALGLGSVLTRLNAKLNWHQLFMDVAGTSA